MTFTVNGRVSAAPAALNPARVLLQKSTRRNQVHLASRQPSLLLEAASPIPGRAPHLLPVGVNPALPEILAHGLIVAATLLLQQLGGQVCQQVAVLLHLVAQGFQIALLGGQSRVDVGLQWADTKGLALQLQVLWWGPALHLQRVNAQQSTTRALLYTPTRTCLQGIRCDLSTNSSVRWQRGGLEACSAACRVGATHGWGQCSSMPVIVATCSGCVINASSCLSTSSVLLQEMHIMSPQAYHGTET